MCSRFVLFQRDILTRHIYIDQTFQKRTHPKIWVVNKWLIKEGKSIFFVFSFCTVRVFAGREYDREYTTDYHRQWDREYHKKYDTKYDTNYDTKLRHKIRHKTTTQKPIENTSEIVFSSQAFCQLVRTRQQILL